MPAKYRRARTKTPYRRCKPKTIRRTKKTYKRRLSAFKSSNTTLKTICEMSRPIEWFDQYTTGHRKQTRNVIGFNNVVTGVGQGILPHDQYFDITQTERWEEYKARFRKVKIHGVKITYNAFQTTKDTEWREQHYATYESAAVSPQFPFSNHPDTNSDKYWRDNMRQRPDFQ